MDNIRSQNTNTDKINFISEGDFEKVTSSENKTLNQGAENISEPNFISDNNNGNSVKEDENVEVAKIKDDTNKDGEGVREGQSSIDSLQEQDKQNQSLGEQTVQEGQVQPQEKTDQQDQQPVQPIKPLKIYGSDYETSDEDEISYYKNMFHMLSIKCGLVGRFTRTGKYIVPDDIKTDLIRMNKEISDSGENYYKANTQYMKKNFFFTIKMEMIDDKKAKASLYLQEEADGVFSGQYLTSHIADFVEEYSEYFRINVRKVFNLLDVALINEDFRIPALALLMQDYIDLELFIAGLYDTACQMYLLKMLKLLEEEGGEEGLEILKRYKELIAHLELGQGEGKSKYKYANYKNMLDKAILEKGGLSKLNLPQDKVKNIVKEMNKSVKSIEDLKLKPAAVEVMKPKDNEKKETQQPQSKPSKAKKEAKPTSAKTSAPKVKSAKAKGTVDEGEEWEPFDFGDNKSSAKSALSQGDSSKSPTPTQGPEETPQDEKRGSSDVLNLFPEEEGPSQEKKDDILEVLPDLKVREQEAISDEAANERGM